jgi:putative alpha-1,2-mannosidase
MKACRRLAALALALALAVGPAAAGGDLTQHVDPFIGTDGTGHVTPAAMVPFGMVAPGPDNADRGWSYSSGYQYRAPRILGFSNTHISGAGIPELGDVLLMPAAGTRWDARSTDFSAAPDKTTESARAGVYRVTLPAHGVRVELTATQRVAVHRYTFDRPGAVQVVVDLQHGLLFGEGPRVTRAASQVDDARGEVTGTTHAKNWVEREASFIVRFDRPVRRVITLPARDGEQAARYVLDFDLGAGRVLHARVALSTVDVDGARRNLAVDESKPFDAVRAAADGQWQRLLSRITIDADARFKRIFYSALYRTLLHPSDIADADGRVRGPTGQVMAAPGGVYYSTLSLWDTFRAVHPLFTLLVPERVPGFVHAAGPPTRPGLPAAVDGLGPRDTHDDRQPGAAGDRRRGGQGLHRLRRERSTAGHGRDLDPAPAERARLGAARVERLRAVRLHPHRPDHRRVREPDARAGHWRRRRGPCRARRGAHRRGRALRATRQRLAATVGRQTQTMRGKDSAGRWREPFDPLVPTSPMNNPGDYTEANAWQYTLTPALHDPAGLMALMGGAPAFEAWLDRFFTLQAPGDNQAPGPGSPDRPVRPRQ